MLDYWEIIVRHVTEDGELSCSERISKRQLDNYHTAGIKLVELAAKKCYVSITETIKELSDD